MYYVIYKITNQINGKFYIGSHKTKDLNDGYMGSGKYLKYAQEKHGLENFTKEILFVFDTPELMYLKEAEIVNEKFLSEENTYNLKIGGFGGWDYNNTIEGQKLREFSYEKWQKAGSESFIKKFYNDEIFKKQHLNHCKKALTLGLEKSKKKYPNGTFYGKKHSTETKQKISSVTSISQLGEKNSQYGTMWITNGVANSKIKKTDPIPLGWTKGRKLK